MFVLLALLAIQSFLDFTVFAENLANKISFMDSRKRRPSLFDVDAATLALLNESSDDDSTDSEEEPCMHNDEDDILLSEYGESDNNVSSDFDDLDLMSDSDTENSSSETHSDDSDQTFGSNPTVPDPT